MVSDHVRPLFVLAALLLLAACSKSPEDKTAWFERNCFSNTVECVAVKIELESAKTEHYIEQAMTPAYRDQFIAEHGKAAYRETLLKAKQETYEMQLAMPSWSARTFSGSKPYEARHSAMFGSDEKDIVEHAKTIEAEMVQFEKKLDAFLAEVPAGPANTGTAATLQQDISTLGDDSLAPGALPASPEATPVPDSSATAASVPAPSFDCAKASSTSEKLICSDAELAGLDARLADGYRRLLSITDDPSGLKQEQVGWLKTTRNPCSTVDCLKSAYQARIDDLETTAQYLSKPAEFR